MNTTETKSKLKNEIELPEIKRELKKNEKSDKKVTHSKVLSLLLLQIKPVDFRILAGMKSESEKLSKKHFLICCVEHILKLAKENSWGVCRYHDFIYVYNGSFWDFIDENEFQVFLGKAAEKMGLDKFESKYYIFQEQLMKQFLSVAILDKLEQPENLINTNLLNGTFEISPDKQFLRSFKQNDFLKYQLPFEYNALANCPLFTKYLNEVVPPMELQNILAEYIGYLFIQPSILKLEKTLLLYGSGANGKSVFFEIICALLGKENISNYSLQSLTNDNGYFRAALANKLVNYASEINGKLESAVFKQLVSGEPVEARSPYGNPFILSNYAKLIFNCNELPKEVEHTEAFFRRFLIIPFNITIAEKDQDKELSKKIISSELSGIFNWVLEGLSRLLKQKNFTQSELVQKEINLYKKQSDSVQLFLEEENFVPSIEEEVSLKELYTEYKSYCILSGYRSCSVGTFSGRLKKINIEIVRKNIGNVVFIERKSLQV